MCISIYTMEQTPAETINMEDVMRDMMEKSTVKFIAKFVSQFLNETVTSAPDMTVHVFVNSQIELFSIWLFKTLQLEKHIKFNTMGITPDAIKDIVTWTIITKLQLVGKYASLYTNYSKTITVKELLAEETIFKFMNYCKNAKDLAGDIFDDMMRNPEMLWDAIPEILSDTIKEMDTIKGLVSCKEMNDTLACARCEP